MSETPETPSMTEGNAELMPREGESLNDYRARMNAYFVERVPADPGEPLAIFFVRVKAVEGEKMAVQQERLEALKKHILANDDVLDVAMTHGTPRSARDKDMFGQEARRRAHEFVRSGWPASPKILDPVLKQHPDYK